MARSLPTAVPESPRVQPTRTPKTPRTPRLQDPNKTPRFYPVVKESRIIDVGVTKTKMYFWIIVNYCYYHQRAVFETRCIPC